MLRPVIMIGCGGSGQKAVRYVRDSVRRHLEHKGWEGGFPKSWQFIGIDTLTTQEDPNIPFLPNNDYLSIYIKNDNFIYNYFYPVKQKNIRLFDSVKQCPATLKPQFVSLLRSSLIIVIKPNAK